MLTATMSDNRSTHVCAMIDELDLSMIKLKLTHPEEGVGWNAEQADEAEVWYKQFLKLHVLHPGKSIVPTGMIDTMWHQHILDTRKYAADCQQIFGKFMHHYPYFGLNGEDDARDLENAFEETREIFIAEFGVCPTQATACKKCRQCRGCKHSPEL